jgi:cytochrome c biogenesis protein CcmG/thiol:disulfide interchange protein DsbE
MATVVASATSRSEDPRARARRRALWAAAVFLVLFVVNGGWILHHVRRLGPKNPAAVGQPAPVFRGRLLEGGELSLADLRGRVVLLEFWATWCGPCMTEMPMLVGLMQDLGPRGLVVVGVNLEGASAERAVRDVVEEAKVHFPIVLDDGAVSELYRVRALPHRLLLDRTGTIRGVMSGGVAEDQLRGLLEPWLRE